MPTHKENLIEMLTHAGIECSEFKPDESDKEHNPEWDSSVVFFSDYPEGATMTPFDFDKDGNLLSASSFLDLAENGICPDCGEEHGPEDGVEFEVAVLDRKKKGDLKN